MNWRAPITMTVALLTAVPLVAVGPAWAADEQVASSVQINEVESNGGTPGDWVELVNTGATSVDVSGWVVKDNDDSHVFTIAAGTTMAAGAFLALDVDPVYGLGSADSARLFLADGTTLEDSYSWTSHAATTYGRCADGTGPFVITKTSTKGAANDCGGQVSASPWPGGSAVAAADDANTFGTNLSGLAYQASGGTTPGVLWAVKNGPGTLYRLEWDGTKWTPATTDGWNVGKALHYPGGTGDPDSEVLKQPCPDDALLARGESLDPRTAFVTAASGNGEGDEEDAEPLHGALPNLATRAARSVSSIVVVVLPAGMVRSRSTRLS